MERVGCSPYVSTVVAVLVVLVVISIKELWGCDSCEMQSQSRGVPGAFHGSVLSVL